MVLPSSPSIPFLPSAAAATAAASRPEAFSFGPAATSFTAGGGLSDRGGDRELRRYKTHAAQLAGELVRTRRELAAARSELEAAQASSITTSSSFPPFHPSSLPLPPTAASAANAAMSEEAAYDETVKLSGLLDEQREAIKQLRDQNSELKRASDARNAELEEREAQIKAGEKESSTLKRQLEEVKEELDIQRATVREVEDHLQSSYADRDVAMNQLHGANKEKDDRDVTIRDQEIQLQHLTAQLDEHAVLAHTNELLKEEIEDHIRRYDEIHEDQRIAHRALEERDHELYVKSARITALEDHLQRALTDVRLALSAAEYSTLPSNPSDPPPPLPQGLGENLQAELENLEDDGLDYLFEDDTVPQYENLENLVGVLDHATVDIPPVSPTLTSATVQSVEVAPIAPVAPKLSIAAVQTIDVAPIAPKLSTAAVQTIEVTPVAPKLGTSTIQSIEVIPTAPKLSSSAVQTIEVVPITPKLSSSAVQTIEVVPVAPKLSKSAVKSVDVEPIAPITPTLSSSAVQTVEVAPVAPKLSSSAIQSVEITPVVPKLSHSKVHSTLDISPATPKLYKSAITDTLDLAPITLSTPDLKKTTIIETLDQAPTSPITLSTPDIKKSTILETLDLAPASPTTLSTPDLKKSIIFETLDLAPASPTTKHLAKSAIQDIETAPVAPEFAHSHVQTDLSLTTSDGALTIAPKKKVAFPSISAITSIFGQSPVEARAVEVEVEKTIIIEKPVARSSSDFWQWAAFLLSLVVAILLFQVTSSEGPNNVDYVGAFGNPHVVFGIPVGYSIGPYTWTETLVKHADYFLELVDKFFGVERVVLV